MKFVTFTDYPVWTSPFLCDDFLAKVRLYLLLRIEHLDILDPLGIWPGPTGTQVAICLSGCFNVPQYVACIYGTYLMPDTVAG